MAQVSGQSNYAQQKQNNMAEQVVEGAKAVSDKAQDLGSQALDQAEEWLKPVGLSIKERPMTCLAVVGGVAFALGAYWTMRSARSQSRFDELAQQLSDYARRSRWW